MKKLLFTLFYILSLTQILICQNLNKSNSFFKTLDSTTLIISYDFVWKSGITGLENEYIGKGIIKYKDSDTLKYHHNIWLIDDEKNVHQQIYNGISLGNLDHEKKECLLINLDSFKFGYSYITGNIIQSFIPTFLYDSFYFEDILNSENLINYSVTEEFIFNTKCIKLHLKFKDDEDMNNNTSNYYFDSQTKICLGYSDSFYFAGNSMTESFFIFNIMKSCEQDENYFISEIYKDLGYSFKYPQKKVTNLPDEKVIKEPDEIKFKENTLFDFEKYKGKVLVLDFWYIGCAPCLKLIPVMEKLYSEFPDVAFIGINKGDKPEKIKKFVEKRGIKYPVFPDETGLVKKYNMNSFPQVFIYNKTGNLIKRFEGYSDSIYDHIKSVIEEELKK